MLEDEENNIWLSTSHGLTRLNPWTGQAKTFDLTHGLQVNDFHFGAHYKSRDGRMFFGGPNGFNVFHPSQVRDNEHVPPIVLTEFLKFNEPVALDPASDGPIELRYDDSVVAFEFATLDFTAPERNRYRYMLEGFDQDWNELGTLRRVTYTNLRSGNYTLRVRASNNDGIWNEAGIALALAVGTPPWMTVWALSGYSVILAGFGWALVRRHRHKAERQAQYQRQLERDMAERTAQLATQNSELGDLNDKLQEVSITDSLTGLWNRRYLIGEMPKNLAMVRRARGDKSSTTDDVKTSADPNLLFLLIDLDGLKWINDTYGHQAGDRAIV